MRVELIQGEAVVEVDLVAGEHSVGGGEEDALRFEGLHPRLLRLRVDERRVSFCAIETIAVDGILVPAGVWRLLVEREVVELGDDCHMRLSEETVTEPATAQTGMVLKELLESGASQSRGIPALTCLTGMDMGRVFPLPEGERVIGRGVDAAIRIRDRTASRRHAAVRSTADGYVLEDLGSPNGVYLNGVAMLGPTLLAEGDIVELGRTLLRVTLPTAEASPLAGESGMSALGKLHTDGFTTEPASFAAEEPGSPALQGLAASFSGSSAADWALIGVGAGLTLMGALMGVGLLP